MHCTWPLSKPLLVSLTTNTTALSSRNWHGMNWLMVLTMVSFIHLEGATA